jgi:hypothetical protein
LVDRYAPIYEATYGIVFFGTPHGGGNNAKAGSLAADIARFLASRGANSFMEALKKNSFYGEQNRDDFLQLAKDFVFLTFYEANRTKKLNVRLVPLSSSYTWLIIDTLPRPFPLKL